MKLSVFFEIPTAVQIHMICATSSLAIGLFMLLSIKGSKHHKAIGWVWIILMIATATSAAFIHQLRMIWIFSPIHAFVPITFVGIFEGVRHARAGRVAAHRSSMQSMYWGALCIPFSFALMPSRVLANMFGFENLEFVPMALVASIVLGVGAYYRWESFWQKSIQRLRSTN